MSIADDIKALMQADSGRVWCARDFANLGGRTTVDSALSRMTADNVIARVDHGLYYLPWLNKLTSLPSAPDHMAVIDAVARRDRLQVLVDGMTAANNMGFTNAVPSKVVVLTTGRLKPIDLGNLQIVFKHVAPSRLAWTGRPAAQLVQALVWLRDVDQEHVRRRLSQILADPDHGIAIRDDLHDGMGLLPGWLQPTIKTALEAFQDVEETPSAPRV
jgi:hypothetical protein